MIDPSDREFELEAMASHILRDEETPLVTSDHSSPMQTPTNHTKDIRLFTCEKVMAIQRRFDLDQEESEKLINRVSLAAGGKMWFSKSIAWPAGY